MKRNKNVYNQDTVVNKNSIVKIPRTTFNMPWVNQTAFNGGKLIPLGLIECYPGDTISMNLGSFVRVNSPFLKAPMGEIEFSAYAFKIPMRILEDDFEEIIANYLPFPDWNQDVTDSLAGLLIPHSSLSEEGDEVGGFAVGSVADYLGIRPRVGIVDGATITKLNHLPFRAYVKTGDEWFRDENLMNTAGVNTANVDTNGVSTADGDYLTDAICGGALYPVCKIKGADPFTTALPSTQKGAPVIIATIGGIAPVKSDISEYAPVIGDGKALGLTEGTNNFGIMPWVGSSNHYLQGKSSAYGLDVGDSVPSGAFPVDARAVGVTSDPTKSGLVADFDALEPYADLGSTQAISVNDLRLAIQLQRIKEANARYGNRYPEYLEGRWGVRSSDGRLQRPEYLGSQKFILNVNQTVQTSGTTGSGNAATPQSNISAYSVTAKRKFMFETSCVEHAYILIVGCCRIKHRTYAQGIPKTFLKRTRNDFYVPEFANLSEQPIYNAEIYFSGTATDNQAFGFQEAFYDLRQKPNMVTGLMRPDVAESLAIWNFSDNYENLPTLSAAWIQEDMAALDRALVYPSSVTPQFIADFYFDATMTRPMPLHSIPGLMDHTFGWRF